MNTRFRRVGVIGLVLLLALVVAAGAGHGSPGGPADWSTARADSANTGANLAATAPTTDVGPRWTVAIGPSGRGEVGPTIDDETVYVGNGEGVLFAIDAADGAVDWRTDLGESVESSASIDEGLAHVVVRDEADRVEVVAVDRATGEVVWRFAPETDRPHVAVRGQPVTVAGDVFVRGGAYAPDTDPRRFLVAIREGDEQWRYEVGADGLTTPAVADGVVYVGTYSPDTESGHVVALDAATGTERWRTDLDAQPASAPVVVQGEVYVPTWSDVTVLDASTGIVTRQLGIAAGGEDIAVADETVYAVRQGDDALVALDAVTGETRWTADEPFVETAPVVAGNAVVVGANGAVVALDPATGERLWAHTISERLGVGSQLAVVDGAVYVGPSNRHVFALVEGGRAVPGGTIGQIGRAIGGDALLGTLTAIGVASLLAGLVAGAAVLGLVRLLGYSWAPPRLLAARLLRRPYEDVGRWAVLGLHFGLAVLSLFAAGIVYLGGSTLLAVSGRAGAPLLGAGPLIVAALLLLGGVAAWVLVANRWLPAAADAVDRPVGVLRRQAAVVGVAYAVIAGPLFAFLLFLGMMAIFFR